MVPEDVAVEAPVVEDLLESRVFEPNFEHSKHLVSLLSERINPQPIALLLCLSRSRAFCGRICLRLVGRTGLSRVISAGGTGLSR
eukprot:494739-Hanusia_phi.AAC.2